MTGVAAPRTLIGPGGRAFTAEQSEAVRRRDGSLLLEANAGSGKTSVLVERFVRSVLEDDVAPSRILAITFTERAAGELRARVRQRFVELGRRDAARETEAAWVSTIHGFCTRVLRAHAIAAGLDPSFTVLDEAAGRPLRDRAWDDALARLLAGEQAAAALDLVAAYDPDRLRMAIVQAHDALRSAGQTRPALPRPQHLPDPHALRAPLQAAVAVAAAELGGAGDGKTVAAARERLLRCGDLLASTPAGELVPALAKLTLGMGANALKTAACDDYRAALVAYDGACRDARAAQAVALLDELLGDYADAYAEAKRMRAALDFDDLELHARDLLAREPALRRSYAERFERVMVDELQDSNPLQLDLFCALDRDDLFLVGDEQQSIYGFRHADVDVFRALRAQFAVAGQVATLATNFRSHGAILDTINAAFGPRLGEGFVALHEGRATEPASEPLVELLITDQAGWEDIDLGEVRPGARAWRQAEARLLAQRVADLVAAGTHRPEDVVVLLRALGDLPVYERALEDQGLLTMSVGGRGYWGRQVVRDLCAWLAAVANPRDEAALYGVLASPLVGLSSDGLAHIAGAAGTGNAWRAIDNDHALRARLTGDDRERLVVFTQRFAAERALAPRLGLDELLRRVVDATGYDLHVLALAGGERRLANIHKLLRLAADFERDRGRDVRGLADLATAELEAEARETDAPVELGDVKAVRLMSVHAAKGLEFPVVCIADLGRQRPADGDEDLLVAEGEVGLRLVGLDGTSEPALAYERLRDRARARAAGEEARVMYVATTRAQERLIVSGGVPLAAWPQEGPKAPPLAWLGPALLGGDLCALPTAEDPIADVAWGDGARVRCVVNTPQTVGRVLREAALAPAGARLPVAAPAPPRPPVAEPAGAPPVTRTLSYSRLAAWQACGYRYYLQRELGLPDEPVEAEGPGRGGVKATATVAGTGLDPRTRGSLVHALLERPGDDLTTLAAGWGVTLDDEGRADVLRLRDAFAGSPLARRIERARSVNREHPFTVALGDTLLTGVVDVLAHERGGQLVVDYKTDALDPSTDLAAYVGQHYAIQRRVYALAALRGGAARVEVVYAFLERPQEPVAERFEAADADSLQDELRALASGLLAGEYPVAAVPHRGLCETCPGRRSLCSYESDMTLREPPGRLAL